MTENTDDYITRINTILSNSSTSSNIDNISRNTNTINKIKKNNLLFSGGYSTFEQIESLCKRAVILHTKGIYVAPSRTHICKNNNKNRKRKAENSARESNKENLKTTFGSGKIGISCEMYGIKKCSCCVPRKDEDLFLIDSENEPQHPIKKNNKTPSYYIDLTKPTSSSTLSSKNWNNSVISIPDSDPDNSFNEIALDDFEVDKNSTSMIKVENLNLEANTDTTIDFEANTNAVIKAEHADLETKSSKSKYFANVENITDYINLVTTDYDEDAMRKYEEELAETIHKSALEVCSVTANSILKDRNENITTNDSSQIILNEEKTNFKENFIEVIESPVISKTLANEKNLSKSVINSCKENPIVVESLVISKSSKLSTSKLSCPVCLEYLNEKEVMSTICGHIFCTECIKEVIKKTKACPNCRKKLTLKSIHPIYLN